jgi:protein phosphatase
MASSARRRRVDPHSGQRRKRTLSPQRPIIEARAHRVDLRPPKLFPRAGCSPPHCSRGDSAEECEFIARVQTALSKAGFWEEFVSGWFCLDCELMPWSAKARDLIQRQYAAVGAAGVASLEAVLKVVEQSPAAAGLSQTYCRRLDLLRKYREAYRRYCWPVTSLADYRLAPFHLVASEGAVHTDKTNRWHMETLHRLDGRIARERYAASQSILGPADCRSLRGASRSTPGRSDSPLERVE